MSNESVDDKPVERENKPSTKSFTSCISEKSKSRRKNGGNPTNGLNFVEEKTDNIEYRKEISENKKIMNNGNDLKRETKDRKKIIMEKLMVIIDRLSDKGILSLIKFI